MKIANVVCVFYPYKSGISNAAYEFAQLSNEIGNENFIFTPAYQQRNIVNENYNGLYIDRIKPLFKYGNGAFIPSLFRYLKNVDCIYLHYPFFGGAEVVWLFNKLAGKRPKLVLHYHMDVKNLSLMARILSIPSILVRNQLFKQADAIVCSSLDYIKNSDIKELYRKMTNKFYEIPFAVDSEKFFPNDQSGTEYINDIVFVGGLDTAHNFKGVELLIRAFAKISDKNICLKIIGDGDLKPEYVDLAEKLKISGRVKFLSGLSDEAIAETLRSSLALILPSTASNEAFGIVLLEAMASGIPVIASDFPGVRTVFDDGVQGYFIKPGDENDLKQKIEILLSDKQKILEMGRQGRILVEKKYSRQIVKEKVLLLFNKLQKL